MLVTTIVTTEVSDTVAVVILNEPEARNPLSPLLVETLITVLERLAEDDSVRVVVLTGAGRGFSAGADLRRMRSATPTEDRDEYSDILRLNRTLWNFPKPTIAAVHGFALGAGANLMSWCDMAVLDQDAIVGYPEVRAGVPSATVIPTLMRLVSRKTLYELVLTGEPFNAAQAVEVGLANRVAAPGEALAEARNLATIVASREPAAVGFTKKIVQTTTDMSYAHAVEYAREMRVISRLRTGFDVQVSQGGSK